MLTFFIKHWGAVGSRRGTDGSTVTTFRRWKTDAPSPALCGI